MDRRVRARTPREFARARPAGRCETGAVTAETAVVLPLLVALTVGLAWLLSLGVAQVRAVDAARETARALARGEPEDLALSMGRQAAPGASIEVSHDAGSVVVVVVHTVSGPGGLLSGLPGAEVRAQAVAAQEDR